MRTRFSISKSISIIYNQKIISKQCLPITVLFLILLLVLTSFTTTSTNLNLSNISNNTSPPDQLEAQILIEFDEYNHEIDTSPSVKNPVVEIEGTVTLLSQTSQMDPPSLKRKSGIAQSDPNYFLATSLEGK